MTSTGARTSLLAACLGLAALSAIECKSTVIKKAALASGCELDSDCDTPLVCGFSHCHVKCKTSVDCGGGRCLISESGNVCQLPEEERCEYNTDCPDALVCGADGQCHNECRAKRDCLGGQICTPEGECAEAQEVDMGGSLKPPASSAGGAAGTASDVDKPPAGGSSAGERSDNTGGGGKGGITTGGATAAGAGGVLTAGAGGVLTAGAGGVLTAGAGGVLTAGASGVITAGADAGGGGTLDGLALTPFNGWIDPTSNALMVQGAVFGYADPVSYEGLLMNFSNANACISGVAAKVDFDCTIVPPATDCYGVLWGAAIGMNLNQSLDTTVTPPVGGLPKPYDASALKGFMFEVSGNTVPAPANFRFKVESETLEFCNVPSLKLKVGVNSVLFTDLVAGCYKSPTPTAPLATSAQSGLVKLAWQVLTNTKTTVPFDFCISNVRALLK